jgi:predicted metal-binding membrane protein
VPKLVFQASVPRRDRILITAILLLVTGLSWTYLIYLDQQMSSVADYEKAMAAMGMSANRAWTVTDAVFAFIMWAVMMVGMMTPAAAPIMMLLAAAESKRGSQKPSPMVLIFGLGSATVWTVFSEAASVAQWILQNASMMSPAMAASSEGVAGAILIGAGVYQFTPWKSRCLTHCRSPLGFLMSNWRDGKLGAFKMGLQYGMHCLGCCWALMGVLFVVGVMNLLWVAALTVFVLIEKIGPGGGMIGRITGAAMIVLGMMKIF